MGRPPLFEKKAQKVYIHEERLAFEASRGHALPDFCREMREFVEDELTSFAAQQKTGAVTREERGFDKYIRDGSASLRESTNIVASRQSSAGQHGCGRLCSSYSSSKR